MKLWFSLLAACVVVGCATILFMPHIPPQHLDVKPIVPQAWVDRLSIFYLIVMSLFLLIQVGIPLSRMAGDRVAYGIYKRKVLRVIKAHGATGRWEGRRLVLNGTEDQARAIIQQLRDEHLSGWFV